MIDVVSVVVGAVLVGGAAGMVIGRDNPWLGALQTFAVAAVLASIAGQLLPESVAHIGATALLVFAGAVMVPGILAPLVRHLRRGVEVSVHGLGMELAFVGFLGHQVLEGLALGTYASGGGPGRLEVVLAIAAHKVPLTAVFISEALTHRGRRSALRRLALLAAANLLGFALAEWVQHRMQDQMHAWVSAGMAGFLVHVVFHAHGTTHRRTTLRRGLDVVATAVGLGLPLLAVEEGGGNIATPIRAGVADALVELTAEAAPMLLLGLTVGAVLRVTVPRIAAVLDRDTDASADLPARIAAAQLRPETLALTARFLGIPFAAARVVTGLVLAGIARLAFGRRAPASMPARAEVPAPSIGASVLGPAFAELDRQLLHATPWMVVTLLAAAYGAVVLPPGSLAALTGSGLDVVVVALVTCPIYVYAASATPVAAVLVTAGISPGAALVGLLLGPGIDLTTAGRLRRGLGIRSAVLGAAIVFGAGVALGWAVDLVGLPASVPPRLASNGWPGLSGILAFAVLGILLLRQLWRGGLGPWFAVLEARGRAGGHDHAAHHHDETAGA